MEIENYYGEDRNKDIEKATFQFFICKTAMHVTAGGASVEDAVKIAESLAELLYARGHLK